MGTIREPKLERAKDKKDKIIEAGFDLICKSGYYNINTQDIAKEANVSTGIVYQYFKDKHDIFMQGLEKYGDKIFYPVIKVNNKSIEDNIKETIDIFIKEHKVSSKAHEEIMSMVHIDPDVAAYYKDREIRITNKLYDNMLKCGFNETNLKEKVHVIQGLIENFCHEIIYHHHVDMDYNAMENIVIKAIEYILNN